MEPIFIQLAHHGTLSLLIKIPANREESMMNRLPT
jgi:hypothetical protein